MVVAALLSTTLMAGSLTIPPGVRHFPGEYYATSARHSVERVALREWPRPPQLLQLWRSGSLEPAERVAWLLGAGAFHDPDLLPIYAEAVTDSDRKVRQAAAFGFRVLLADAPPSTPPDISAEASRVLRQQMIEVHRELQHEPIVQLWLDSLLHFDHENLSGDKRLVLNRPPRACINALDQLLQPWDLPLVAQAFLRARSNQLRIPLLRTLEGLTARQFIVKPRREGAGWSGSEIYRRGIDDAEKWLESRCFIDFEDELRGAFARVGIRGVDPLGPEACDAWLHILEKMPSRWWPVASMQLHRCGAPPYRVSPSRPDSSTGDAARSSLLRWYGVR